MQRIYYATGSILTGDAIAEAVLAYAEALAKSPLADTIRIPIVNPKSNAPGIATLLIGPASQLMFVEEAPHDLSEPADSELVAELTRRALAIGAARPVGEEDRVVVSEDYE